MLYPMGIAALTWGLHYTLRRQWRDLGALALALVGGAALTLLLYTPILRGYGFEALAGNRHIVTLPYSGLFPALIRLPVDVAEYLFIGLPRIIRYGLALVVGVGLVTQSTDSQKAVPTMVGIAAIAWLGTVLFVQRVIPPVRVWVFIAPLVALWGAVGWLWLIRQICRGFHLTPRPPLREQESEAQHKSPLCVRRGDLGVRLLLPLIVGIWVLHAGVNGGYAISSGAHDAGAAAAFIADDLAPDDTVLFVAGWVHPLWYELERRSLPPERVLLNAPTDMINTADPLYLLAFSDDDFLDNRTREAFGVVFEPTDLTPVTTFPTEEWTLYRVTR
jgi:hypothetical protein